MTRRTAALRALAALPAATLLTGLSPGMAHAAGTASAEEAITATQDFFARLSAGDLPGVSRYLTAEGFTEIVPETDTLLQLNAAAFDGLFKSGRKVDLHIVGVRAQVFGDSTVVTGKRVGSITAAGAVPVERQLAFSMVWTCLAGSWQVRHLHLSALAGP